MAEMDSLCARIHRVSCDAEVANNGDCLDNTRICPDLVPAMEHRFDVYERVSLSFLFYEDIDACIKICEKCVNCPDYGFLSENSVWGYNNWSERLLECIFYVQNILLLKNLGIAKYDAVRYFKTPKFVSKQRLLFYKVCESLTHEEATKIMKCIESLPAEKYTEIYILKVISSENYMQSFLSSLASLRNPIINNLLEELSEDFSTAGFPQLKNPVSKQVKNNMADMYPIKDPNNVGLCFIINEVNFKGQESRQGSMADVSLVESTMKYFHFDVYTFADVPKKFFEEELDKKIKEYFKHNHSVFFMFIMSHGVQGAVYCSDDEPVSIEFIKMKLSSKLLHKIPKVLIVQACQGEKFLLKDVAVDGPGIIDWDQSTKKNCKAPLGVYISDFLLAMSTVPGFKAMRDLSEGTWFIQTLCKCLRENENECIYSIITLTIKRVKDLSIPTKLKIDIGQQPQIISLFEKKLYLKSCVYDWKI